MFIKIDGAFYEHWIEQFIPLQNIHLISLPQNSKRLEVSVALPVTICDVNTHLTTLEPYVKYLVSHHSPQPQ